MAVLIFSSVVCKACYFLIVIIEVLIVGSADISADYTRQQNLTFFGTRRKISNPNRNFNTKFKYVRSFSPSPTAFFCDSQVNCERNVYIYILHTLFTLPKM